MNKSEELLRSDPRTRLNLALMHVDIGNTGSWSWPLGARNFRLIIYCPLAYPDLRVEDIERLPSAVLIDFRWGFACLVRVISTEHEPVRLRFDDYSNRLRFNAAENYIGPFFIEGRIDVFDFDGSDLARGSINCLDLAKALPSCAASFASFCGGGGSPFRTLLMALAPDFARPPTSI